MRKELRHHYIVHHVWAASRFLPTENGQETLWAAACPPGVHPEFGPARAANVAPLGPSVNP